VSLVFGHMTFVPTFGIISCLSAFAMFIPLTARPHLFMYAACKPAVCMVHRKTIHKAGRLKKYTVNHSAKHNGWIYRIYKSWI